MQNTQASKQRLPIPKSRRIRFTVCADYYAINFFGLYAVYFLSLFLFFQTAMEDYVIFTFYNNCRKSQSYT